MSGNKLIMQFAQLHVHMLDFYLTINILIIMSKKRGFICFFVEIKVMLGMLEHL